jgi:hypothetical protein
MNTLDEGTVTSQLDRQTYPYQVQILDESYLTELSDFQQTTYQKMTDKKLYAPVPDAMIRAVLGEKGLTLGLMIRDKLCGFVCFYFPGNNVDNLGKDAGLPDQELEKVVHWERCLIDQEFRGNHMQFHLGGLLVNATKALDKEYRYMCATVAPTNYPSLHQLFDQQKMVAVTLKKKYGDLWRFVFFQDILHPVQVLHETAIAVDCTDFERQTDFFNQGYYAFQALQDKGPMKILFAKVA